MMEEYKDSTRVAAALTTTITTADGFRKGYMYRKDCAVEIDERRKEKRHDGFAADEEPAEASALPPPEVEKFLQRDDGAEVTAR